MHANNIKYNINWQKAIEVIVWLANASPGLDVYHVAKVLFYAEKKHINRYARPITGDTYKALEHGPVPSGIHDLISIDPFVDPEYLQSLLGAVDIKKNPYAVVFPKRRANLEHFSETDLECLSESLHENGRKTFAQLREMTHAERAWSMALQNQPMDYALMIDDDNPHREEIIEEIRQSAHYVVM